MKSFLHERPEQLDNVDPYIKVLEYSSAGEIKALADKEPDFFTKERVQFILSHKPFDKVFTEDNVKPQILKEVFRDNIQLMDKFYCLYEIHEDVAHQLLQDEKFCQLIVENNTHFIVKFLPEQKQIEFARELLKPENIDALYYIAEFPAQAYCLDNFLMAIEKHMFNLKKLYPQFHNKNDALKIMSALIGFHPIDWYMQLPQELKDDKDIALLFCQKHKQFYEYLTPLAKEDEEIIYYVTQDIIAGCGGDVNGGMGDYKDTTHIKITQIPPSALIKVNKLHILIHLLEKNPELFKDEALQAKWLSTTEHLLLLSGYLKYYTPPYKQRLIKLMESDNDVAIRAIAHNAKLFKYINPQRMQDPEFAFHIFCQQYYQQKDRSAGARNLFAKITPVLLKSPQFCTRMMSLDMAYLHYIPEEEVNKPEMKQVIFNQLKEILTQRGPGYFKNIAIHIPSSIKTEFLLQATGV